jgi:mono/diheme cytochrome c family protein
MRRALVIVAVGAALAVAAGCSGEHEVAPLPETVVGDVEAPPAEAPPAEEPPAEAPPAEELSEGDPAAGKEIFNANGCGSCHTLADAGSSGTIGPNLDESQPDLELVITRVTNGAGAMPAFRDQLDDQQIADVAAYVVQATSG